MSATTSSSTVCNFHRSILREAVDTPDFLLVLGAGLGLDSLLALFVRLYSSRAANPGLVLFLNADKDFAKRLAHEAQRGNEPLDRTPHVIHDENQAGRAKVYARGGVVFVNPQILVVDLLRSLVPYEHCTGVLVANAHHIEEHTSLWFALRLLRYHSKSTFVKGFSSRAGQLQAGNRCEAALRALLANKLFLWPRFEARIADELAVNQPEVVELGIELSPRMAGIHNAIRRIIVMMIAEISKSQKALDLPQATLDNALTENWYSRIFSQLYGNQWHQVGAKTKQLVMDLGPLRKMGSYLLHYDCVLFNRYLETIRLERFNEHSAWLFDDAADELFRVSRERVYAENAEKEQELVLETSPKWAVLREVLAEIRSEELQSNVLIVCKDERAVRQLHGVLSKGDLRWLHEQWQTSVDRGMYRVRGPGAGAMGATPSAGSGKGSGGKPSSKKKARKKQVMKTTAEFLQQRIMGVVGTLPALPPPPTEEAASRREDFRRTFGPVQQGGIVIHPLDSSTKDPAAVLEQMKPLYVVMYDTDLAFLRALECYKNTPQGRSHGMRVYLLSYNVETADTQELDAENEAFEKLIMQKSKMLIEEERGQVVRAHPALDTENLARLSRVGGGRSDVSRPYVVVDTREFMGSKIPSKLWMRGFDCVPLMIEVGDYVVSDEVCIERKTVPDLIGSFADGRLYQQCLNMFKHYPVVVLLLEFNGSPFMLEPKHQLPQQVSPNSLASKLSLLVLHFPQLRIFWSRNTAQSVAFVARLRSASTLMAGGPDLDRVNAAGVNNVLREEGGGLLDVTPRIFLQKMPGILSGNIDAVASHAGSLAKLLMDFSEKTYGPIMGTKNAKDFGGFIRKRYKD